MKTFSMAAIMQGQYTERNANVKDQWQVFFALWTVPLSIGVAGARPGLVFGVSLLHNSGDPGESADALSRLQNQFKRNPQTS